MKTSLSHLQHHDVPLEEALERWLLELDFLKASSRTEVESVAIDDSLGRVTASPVVARLSTPHYYAAATDGLAVRASATFAASPQNKVKIHLKDEATFVDVGAPMPEGTDAVIPVHELELVTPDEVALNRPSNPWRHVRPIGDDIAAREIVLPRDRRIGPLDVGAMVAAGAPTVQVYRRPVVAVVPVGNNLVEPGQEPELGQMLDCNGPIVAGLVRELGGEPERLPVVPERLEEAGEAIAEAARTADLVVALAGPSHGTAFLARIFSDRGEKVLHGVAVKPGQSVALGVVEGTPVVGLPFHSVAAYAAFSFFARPVLRQMIGQPDDDAWRREEAVLAVDIHSPQGLEEFLRVKMGIVDGRPVAVADAGGASTLMSLVRADGMLDVPADLTRLEAGSVVEVLRLAPERPLASNVLVLGTHDICYDLLRNQLHQSFPDITLHTAATGGALGLRCLKRGFCHIAAIHLFDEETGEHNIPHLKREMADHPVVLVHLFTRHLGLAVAAGNPLGVAGLEDLTRSDLRFINRQPGSGTRSLLEYHLRKLGIESAQIHGFESEVKTHMAVAAAVSGGVADAGPTISTAARALRLDFVPCISERLELAIPKRFFNLYPIRALLQVIRAATFRRDAANSFTDYDFSETGRVIWESE